MHASPQVRALRKGQQTARLAEKAKAKESGNWEGYSQYFASQGLEVAKAEHNAKITNARKAVRSARNDVDVARATGEGIMNALNTLSNAQIQLQSLLTQKEVMFGRNDAAAALSEG